MEQIRVLIVEDESLVRMHLRETLVGLCQLRGSVAAGIASHAILVA